MRNNAPLGRMRVAAAQNVRSERGRDVVARNADQRACFVEPPRAALSAADLVAGFSVVHDASGDDGCDPGGLRRDPDTILLARLVQPCWAYADRRTGG
jgi:hypothetical protein